MSPIMKILSSLSLSSFLVGSIVGAVPFFGKASTSSPQPRAATTNSTIAAPDGRLFNIDGTVEYFAGTNAWWLGHLSNDTDIDTTLQEIADSQYKIVRVWGFGDVNTVPSTGTTDPNKVYFQVLNSTGSYINYGTDGLQRLDYLVSSAETHGVKLVLNFVNNWSDYGGIAAYNTAFGGSATSWYTDSTSQSAYRAYIKAVVSRYASSTAIFAWELANEPRCNGCATSVIYNWANSTSAYIKSLDSAHMVTLGDEGWFASADDIGDGSYAYGGGEGVDFVLNLGIPTLDYGTFHLYPNSWGYDYTWGSTWILEHDAVGESLGKPVILEEYGAPFPHNHTGIEGPWQSTVLLNTSIAADQIWQFGTPDLSISPDSLGDVNTIYYNDTEYSVLGSGHAADMLAKTASD